MAGSHECTVQTVSPFAHETEFKVAVAANARIRCASGFIFADEISHDAFAKLLAHIGHMVLDAQPIGQFASRTDKVGVGFALGKLSGKVVHAHRHAHHLVALFLQHQANRRAVDTSRHGHEYSLIVVHHSFTVYLA